MPLTDQSCTADSDLSDAVLALTDWHAAVATAAAPTPHPALSLCTPDAILVDADGARQLCTPTGTDTVSGSGDLLLPLDCSCLTQHPPAVESVMRFGTDLVALRMGRTACRVEAEGAASCPRSDVTYLMQRQVDGWRICLIADSRGGPSASCSCRQP